MSNNILREYSTVFPIQTIEDDVIVNGNGDITAGFKVLMPEVFSLSLEEAQEISSSFEGMLTLFPSGTIFHKQDFFFLNNHTKKEQIENVVHRENMEMFEGRPILRHYSHIYVTFPIKGGKSRGYNGSLQAVNNYPFKQPFKILEKHKKDISNRIVSFDNRLKSLNGFRVERMDNDDLINVLADYCNLTYDKPCQNGKDKILEPVSIDDNGRVNIGKKILSIQTLVEEGGSITAHKMPKTAPGSTYENGISYTNNIRSKTSMVFPLACGLPINHILNTTIEILDNDQILKELDSEKRSLGFLANFYRPAGVKQRNIETFINIINEHSYQVCRTSVNVMLCDSDLSKLEQNINHVESAFANMNQSKVYNENFDCANLFLAHIPGNAGANFRGFLNTIPQAVCYINKEGMINSDPNGYVFIDRFGCPIVLDLWNSPKLVNRNKILIGPSGSGKSYANNQITNQSLSLGNHVIMLDIGHSYKRLCALHEGKYFDTANKNSLSFNIFICDKDKNGNYIYKDTTDAEGSNDTINFIYTVLADIWKGKQDVTKIEAAMLKKSVEEFYEYVNKTKTFPDLTAYYEFLEKYNDALDSDERQIFNIKQFRILLEPYAKENGNYYQLLNAKTNINILDDKFIVFDLEGVQGNPDIFSLVTIIIIELILQKIKRLPGVRKTLVIDEALDFLLNPKSGEFIAYLYRTVRKKEGEVWILFQNVNFLDSCSKVIRDSIIINTATQILLDHSEATSTYKDIQRILSYKDHEIEMLDSLIKTDSYREFFIRMGKSCSILRMEVSGFANGVFTTKQSEVVEIEKLWKEKGNLVTAIYQYEENQKNLNQ